MTFPEIANDMFWNWRTSGLTVVFPFWKVVSGLDFLSTLIFVFSLSVLWEYMQYVNFKMENYCANSILERTRSMIPGISSSATASQTSIEEATLPGTGIHVPYLSINTPYAWSSTLLYLMTRALGVFLILIYMTFNGYLILTSILGSSVGYLFFRNNALVYLSSKTVR
ncbi:hypothetical protein HMI54_004874 [Coelomomyces lativittatus]|nr:hypothetical protein HMI56_002895 [Coelomomyces lativittatus]KAJ1506676.1 hypothetical protein HMI54_004874 [Coelomomyces lativittatus]